MSEHHLRFRGRELGLQSADSLFRYSARRIGEQNCSLAGEMTSENPDLSKAAGFLGCGTAASFRLFAQSSTWLTTIIAVGIVFLS